MLTGWDCPACGGLRAVNDLSHGNLAAAWHSNALFVVSLPLITGLWLLWLRRCWRGQDTKAPLRWFAALQPVLAAVAIVLSVGFTVWRNTPWGSAFHVS